MKNFFVRIFLFFLGFVVLNVAFFLIVYAFDFTLQKRIESITFNEPKYDVLILGNSLALDGFDAGLMKTYGIEAYNLALGGASLKTSRIQLEEYLSNYTHKPIQIIIGIGSYMIGDFDSESIHPVVDLTNSDHILNYNSIPAFSIKNSAVNALKKIVSEDHRNAYLERGQLRFAKVRIDNTKEGEANLDKDEYLRSEELRKILNVCDEYGIKTIVCEMPGFKNTRNDDPEFIGYLDSTNFNGLFFNLNNKDFCSIFSDSLDWIGNSHLNSHGARKFTERFVAEYLK